VWAGTGSHEEAWRIMAFEPAMRLQLSPWHDRAMARPRKLHPPTASDQLETLLGFRWGMGRPPKHNLKAWTVTDDWPDPVPVTMAEVEVFEQFFANLFDELFSGRD
jgi:hypothetical protein